MSTTPRDLRPEDPDRLAGEHSPATRSPAADHEDALSPSRVVREASEEGRTERIGNNTAVANPLRSPPADAAGERRVPPGEGGVQESTH
jgi:hypothetical protein